MRQEAKIKLKKPQNVDLTEDDLRETGGSLQLDKRSSATEAAIEAAKLRLPHSQNRFKGAFSHLDLFQKAKEQLEREKAEKEAAERAAAEKKERDAAYMKELAEKNKRLVKPASQKDLLKRREEERAAAQRAEELRQLREHRKELRDKRASEGRGVALGLDQASRSKLRRLQAEKQEIQARRDMEQRVRAVEAKRIRDELYQKQ